MPGGAAWIGSIAALEEAALEGELSAEMLAELLDPAGFVVPVVNITFPETTETIQLSPNADVSRDPNDAIAGGGSIAYGVTDDPPDSPDENSTYVYYTTSNDRGETVVGFPDLDPDVVNIVEVRLYCRAISNELYNGAWSFALRMGGVDYYQLGADEDRYFGTAFTTQHIVFPLSPATGLAWTVAEVNSVQCKFIAQPDAIGDLTGQRWTQTYVEVDVTKTTNAQWSEIAVNSRSEGLFEPRVVSWKDFVYSCINKNNSLETATGGATVADTDGYYANIVATFTSEEIRNAPVVVRLISPNVAKEKWHTMFNGALIDWKEVRPRQWALSFKMEERILAAKVPKGKVSEFDFENADAKTFDNFLPVIYGVHSSAGITDDGMITLLRLNTVQNFPNAYLAAFPRIKEITNVYSKESTNPAALVTEGVAADQWQEMFPIVNGRQFSGIYFPAGFATLDPDKITITADLQGIEDVGDGTGNLIINPAEIIKHFIVNFIYNDYQSGLWYADTTAPVDVDIFTEAATEFNNRGQAASRFIGGKGSATKARDELNRFTKQLEIKIFWTRAGNIAIKLNNLHTLDVYPEELIMVEGLNDIQDPSYIFDNSGVISRIFISYTHQQSSNKFLANVEVQDFNMDEAGSDNIQSLWLPSSLPGEIPIP